MQWYSIALMYTKLMMHMTLTKGTQTKWYKVVWQGKRIHVAKVRSQVGIWEGVDDSRAKDWLTKWSWMATFIGYWRSTLCMCLITKVWPPHMHSVGASHSGWQKSRRHSPHDQMTYIAHHTGLLDWHRDHIKCKRVRSYDTCLFSGELVCM